MEKMYHLFRKKKFRGVVHNEFLKFVEHPDAS